MKKLALITLVTLIMATAPVALAKSENSNNDHGKGQEVSAQVRQDDEHKADSSQVPQPSVNQVQGQSAVSPSSSPASSNCDPDGDWKNHGQYVSCVAHEHEGGESVSEAARSDVGKNHHGSPKPSFSPSASPVASQSASPSISPEPSSSASSSASPEGTASGQNIGDTLGSQIQGIIDALQGLIHSLQGLIK